MSKPILYYHPMSPPSRAVLMVAKEIGLEFDERIIGFGAAEGITDEFKKKNPQGTVPTFEDVGGEVIWDSHAINTYIISKYAKNDKLYPTDLLKRARIDQRLHFDSALFVRGYDILKPIFVDSATEISQGQKDALDRGYQLLELFLESGTYLVGDSLSVADLSCAAFIESAKGMSEISDKKYPKIIAWLDRLSMELPYYNEMNRKNAENHINMFRAIMQKNKSNAEKK